MKRTNNLSHPEHAADTSTNAPTRLHVQGLLERACGRIAPTWPLDRFIAVNPFWEMSDRAMPEVSAELTALSGTRLLMPRAWYWAAFRAGQLREEHLCQAIAEDGAGVTLAELYEVMQGDEPKVARRARVVDVADEARDLVHELALRDFVTQSVSQLCAAFFDAGQAELGPDRTGGLYACWRRHAVVDKSPRLLAGLRGYGAVACELPTDALEMATLALSLLDVPEQERGTYLTGLLLDLNGWAAWCAYRRWTARQQGESDSALMELLAIRLAWEWMLLRLGGPRLAGRWQRAMATWPASLHSARDSQAHDWLLQRALELGWQEQICRQLPQGLKASAPSDPAVQAVFCIDVRSEVYRRALEACAPAVQTLGFAGFFGLPIEYQPLGASTARPQLPGLLAPRFRVTDAGLPPEVSARRTEQLALEGAWKRFRTGALSAFSFVESVGFFYAAKLLHESFHRAGTPQAERVGSRYAEDAPRRPRLTASLDGGTLELSAKADLAAGMLRAMSLTHGFAPVVLLVGHGSRSRNNPHAAALNCGACCGQTGEVNARAAAALLNEPEVRDALVQRGILVPNQTHFLPALHDTTTDEVQLFDLDELPASHSGKVSELGAWLRTASTSARSERAARLGLDAANADSLHSAVRERASDWSQVRPEWGLANNAAFIVAPREHTRHLDLQGRSFLHDYRASEDEGFQVLELIMTAPMVVTHWINMQYYASTVDNLHYGSGNKVLHNVVGGHLGVFEGNAGDLRIGLPMQCLHDGQEWMHTPLRLSVFIEAPRAAIEAILATHDKVRSLVDNAWLDLFQIDAARGQVHVYRRGGWVTTQVCPA